MIKVNIRRKPGKRYLQLYYVDPLTGLDVTKSSGTESPRQAERAAATWESEVNARVGASKTNLSWDAFRLRYETEHLSSKATKTQSAGRSALDLFESAIGHPKRIRLIDSTVISRVQSTWREKGMTSGTIAAHLGHLRAAFGWARKQQYIDVMPYFNMPKKRRRLMRGRPITVKECRNILRSTKSVVGSQWRLWTRFQHGLWLSGLRLAEAIKLSWDSPPVRIQLDGAKYPRMIFTEDGQKSRRDEIVPLTPDFAKFLKRVPAEKRNGLVLPLFSTIGKDRPVVSEKRIGRVLSAIGRAAGVVVNDDGKHASAHEFRRAFGTRWALKVTPVVLKKMMRHESINTTMQFYVDAEIDDIGKKIWE